MRTLILVIALALAPIVAQAEFVGKDGSVYTMPNMNQRVKDRGAIRIVTTSWIDMRTTRTPSRPFREAPGNTIRHIFRKASDCEEKETCNSWTILHVNTVFRDSVGGTYPEDIAFRFLFTHTDNVKDEVDFRQETTRLQQEAVEKSGNDFNVDLDF
jgi:hypothetical protein